MSVLILKITCLAISFTTIKSMRVLEFLRTRVAFLFMIDRLKEFKKSIIDLEVDEFFKISILKSPTIIKGKE